MMNLCSDRSVLKSNVPDLSYIRSVYCESAQFASFLLLPCAGVHSASRVVMSGSLYMGYDMLREGPALPGGPVFHTRMASPPSSSACYFLKPSLQRTMSMLRVNHTTMPSSRHSPNPVSPSISVPPLSHVTHASVRPAWVGGALPAVGLILVLGPEHLALVQEVEPRLGLALATVVAAAVPAVSCRSHICSPLHSRSLGMVFSRHPSAWGMTTCQTVR